VKCKSNLSKCGKEQCGCRILDKCIFFFFGSICCDEEDIWKC